MADSSNLQDELYRGQRAEVLLNDPLLVEAFEAIEKELLGSWLDAPEADVAKREHCWISMRLLRRVKAKLQNHVETGRLAQISLTSLQRVSHAEMLLESGYRSGG